jgi:TRAP-type uncharacterized transport system substrate-binding protein
MSLRTRTRSFRRRAKLMLRHTWLMGIAALLLCAGITALAVYLSGLPTPLRAAVGPRNSDDLKVVTAIAQQLARDRASVRLRVTAKDGGTRAAAEALDRGEADIAVVRGDIGMPVNGQVVAILRKNVAVLILPGSAKAAEDEDAEKPGTEKPAAEKRETAKPQAKGEPRREKPTPARIERIDDLIGKRLGIVGRSEANVGLLRVVLRENSVTADSIELLGADADGTPNDPEKVNVVQLDPANVVAAIRERKVPLDAVLSVGPVSSTITADAVAAMTRDRQAPKFLPIASAEAVAQRNPIYEATEIRAGAFGGSPPRPEENIDTIGVSHYIVAHRRLTEDTIAEFTRLLFTMRPALSAEAPTAARIEAPDTEKGSLLPVHPGAVAYIDGEVKTFFDRYSDFIYLGLFGLSFLGSGIAGLATYSRSTARSRYARVLTRLLAVAKAARSAQSLQALDELQDEADGIVSNMVRDVERKSLDSAALNAFSISLDQARHALTERRMALLGVPAAPRATVASG